MEYAIIILIVTLALAPLWHFMPSKRQRHQTKMREAAALAGLFVEFRDLPLSPQRLARLPASERQVLFYGCRLKASRKEPRQRCAWYRERGEWISFPPRLTPPELALKVPESVLALSSSEDSCGLFWREEGDENLVREMAVLLKLWRDALNP